MKKLMIKLIMMLEKKNGVEVLAMGVVIVRFDAFRDRNEGIKVGM